MAVGRPRTNPLNDEDVALIIQCKRERERLRREQQVIRQQLEWLSDDSLAKKFSVPKWRVTKVEA